MEEMNIVTRVMEDGTVVETRSIESYNKVVHEPLLPLPNPNSQQPIRKIN